MKYDVLHEPHIHKQSTNHITISRYPWYFFDKTIPLVVTDAEYPSVRNDFFRLLGILAASSPIFLLDDIVGLLAYLQHVH